MFAKFGMEDYWISSLLGIPFGDNLNFQIFAKNGKTQICFYLLNCARWAISSKFSTHRVPKKCTFGNFQKNLLSPKMAAILNFRTFAKNAKTQFYCVNTSYPMDNCFTGRRDRSRQTPEKDVLYIIPAGPVSSVHSLGGASYLLPV